MRGILVNLFGLALVLVISAFLQACNSARPSSVQAPPPMPVKVMQLQAQTVEDASTFVGVLKSRQSVALQPQVAGQVTKIYVRNGDSVAARAPLMELDRSKQQASVSSFSAAIDSTRAEQKNALETLKSLQATRLSKLANVKYAQQQHDRYQTLCTQGAVSQEQVDQWENQLKVGEGDLQAVEAQVQAQRAVVGKSEKLVNQASASMKEQQAQLKYFTVSAPFSGVIGDIPVKEGQYVTTATALMTIDQSRPLELYLSVPTVQAPKLKIGTPVQILNGEGKRIGLGKIFFISPEVSNDNQSVLVKTKIENENKAFRSGQYVTARVIWSKQSGLTVPTNAVSRVSGQDFIFVAEKGPGNKLVAKQKPVMLGDIIGSTFKVISGVSAGDTIVTSGVQNLTDGAAISPQS